jgi:integral membrane protein
MKEKKLLHRFRMIGIAEGISFLVLLIIAMPLKYFYNQPLAVKYVGWAHGALFVAYIYFD